MTKIRTYSSAVVAGCFIAGGATADDPVLGTIVAIGDEWLMSNDAFVQNAASTTQLALNVADLLSGGQAGADFLVYSDNFGLRGSTLASTMTGAGYGWDATATITLDLPTLQAYDAVLLSGELGRTPADIAVLSEYVIQGGSVLVLGGTSGSASSIADAWNPLLALGGLEFGRTKFAGSFVDEYALSDGASLIDDGVAQITWGNGQNVIQTGVPLTSGGVEFVTADFSGVGLSSAEPVIGVYQIPAPGAWAVLALATGAAARRRR